MARATPADRLRHILDAVTEMEGFAAGTRFGETVDRHWRRDQAALLPNPHDWLRRLSLDAALDLKAMDYCVAAQPPVR